MFGLKRKAKVKRFGNVLEIDKYRIEPRPASCKGIATAELLDNAVTASHYQVGRKDALGDEIVLGKEMAYLDYKSPRKVWGVYEHDGERWQVLEIADDEAAARRTVEGKLGYAIPE